MQNTQTVSNNEFSLRVKKAKKSQIAMKITSQTVLYIVLTILAIVSLMPFIFMIFSSFMTDSQYRQFAEIQDMIPRPFIVTNYENAFMRDSGGLNFLTGLFNTLVVALGSTLFSMIILILSAFAFARLEFKGKEVVFSILLATMMIPGELFTITNFLTISNLDLRNTLVALVLPFMVSVYYIYLLRNTFKQIPDELYRAAKIDGVSDFKYLIKVMIPLASPTLISILILKIIGIWNSYIWPQLINTSSTQLLSNWMANSGYPATGDTSMVQIPIRMAAAVIITIPLLIVFLCFRRYIMRGISKSGIKG